MLAIRNQELDGALGTHLVEVLGDAGQRLGCHHPRHRQPGCRHREHQQGQHLHAQADVHGAIEPQASAEVAAHQVGDHAENFVEQEQRGDLQRRVAQRMEVQNHQHAQRAVGEGEGPVVAGNQQVLTHLCRQG
ncbi:hypothetical protein D3C75_853930 [compost metagenome]